MRTREVPLPTIADRHGRHPRGRDPYVRAMLMLVLTACAAPSEPVQQASVRAGATARLEYSAASLGAGERLAVALRVSTPAELTGVQFILHYDPSRLRYVGMTQRAGDLLAVNTRESSAGLLRVASANAAGLAAGDQRLLFESRGNGSIGTLSVEVEELVDREGAALMVAGKIEAVERTDLSVSSDGLLRATGPEWSEVRESEARASALIGNGPFRYGDVNGSGSVTIGDVVVVLNASVGAVSLIGDAFVVGNIAPTNLGSTTMSPGTSADGTRAITVADVVLLQRATVDNTTPVVGTVVPASLVGPRFLLTPMRPRVASFTSACGTRLAAGIPFADASLGRPWPECMDQFGHPMVVQFCGYVKLASGQWIADASSASAERCRRELLVVQRGGL